ncbi:glutamate [NMDA] receptor subunit 1-like isoform X2 [Daphnia pulex]|nr:glutamate [NMDA] receptor subunit 1-like isoform X2 [Daphnia pulex]
MLVSSRVSISLLEKERQQLHGLQLRASAFNFPPCLSIVKKPSGNVTYFGICHDIVSWIAEHFHMQLIFVPTDDTDIVRHGIIPALISQIVKGEVDIIPYAFAPTTSHLLQLDFTITLRVEDYNLLQQWPKEESRLTAYIRPFSLMVWILFLISTGAMILCMSILTYYHQQWSENWKWKSFTDNIDLHANYVITVITGQGNHISSKTRFSLRLVVGLWCLTMVALVNAYTSTLMSYLTVPKLKPIVNTLADLAASLDTQVTVDFESDPSRIFLDASVGPNVIIGDFLRNNPQFLVKGSLEGLKNVLHEGATYFANRAVVYYFMAMDMKSHGKCRLTSSDPIPYIRTYSFGLPKNSRHNAIINHDLEYLLESGLLPFWLKRYTPNIDKCLVGKTKPQRRMMPFTLLDLSSAFLFLGIGVGLSFFTFLLEVMTQFKRKQQNKIRRVLVAQPLLL